MNFDLSVRYFSLVVIVGLLTESECSILDIIRCHRVKGENNNRVVICPAPARTRDDVCNMQDTWVVVTVNPNLDTELARRLQIIWHVPELQLGDIVKLYKSSRIGLNKPIFKVIPYSEYGISETNIYETFIHSDLKFKPVCVGYYVIYWRENEALASSCLQTNPTWMKQYNLGHMRLWDMFIPGTHDSSAYHTAYNPQAVGRIANYVYTQEENILEQLLHGARALDLRVGKDKGTYYAHHGIAQLYPFQEVMNNITLFLDKTEEIVILDFHDFPIGFHDDKDHMEFLNHVYSQLGPYMVPPQLGWNATLEDIWATGKRLIVSYNHPTTFAARGDILWSPITQMWGNVQNITDLYDYLASAMKSPPEGMWSAQAELTAKFINIAYDNLGGLRKMAQEANTQVSKWFRGRWGRACHIVAMDFIRASSIVNIAIEWNLRKSYKMICPVDLREEQERKIEAEIEERVRKAAEEESRKEAEEKERKREADEDERKRKLAEEDDERKRKLAEEEGERKRKSAEEEEERKIKSAEAEKKQRKAPEEERNSKSIEEDENEFECNC